MTTPADTPAVTPAVAGFGDIDPSEVVDANDLRDTALDDDTDTDLVADLPLEADPADYAEQAAAAPFDDDDR